MCMLLWTWRLRNSGGDLAFLAALAWMLLRRRLECKPFVAMIRPFRSVPRRPVLALLRSVLLCDQCYSFFFVPISASVVPLVSVQLISVLSPCRSFGVPMRIAESASHPVLSYLRTLQKELGSDSGAWSSSLLRAASFICDKIGSGQTGSGLDDGKLTSASASAMGIAIGIAQPSCFTPPPVLRQQITRLTTTRLRARNNAMPHNRSEMHG